MKKDIHPTARPVIFRDSNNQAMFLARSTAPTDQTGTYSDGQEYPLLNIDISSATHPFYTGTQQLVDTAGRIERFNRRYQVGAASTKVAKKSAAGATKSTAAKSTAGSAKGASAKGAATTKTASV